MLIFRTVQNLSPCPSYSSTHPRTGIRPGEPFDRSSSSRFIPRPARKTGSSRTGGPISPNWHRSQIRSRTLQIFLSRTAESRPPAIVRSVVISEQLTGRARRSPFQTESRTRIHCRDREEKRREQTVPAAVPTLVRHP